MAGANTVSHRPVAVATEVQLAAQALQLLYTLLAVHFVWRNSVRTLCGTARCRVIIAMHLCHRLFLTACGSFHQFRLGTSGRPAYY
jgi:hypothetical protein